MRVSSSVVTILTIRYRIPANTVLLIERKDRRLESRDYHLLCEERNRSPVPLFLGSNISYICKLGAPKNELTVFVADCGCDFRVL